MASLAPLTMATTVGSYTAGAQRSDPKVGDPNDYPYGHGPQGDVIRIYNYVRLVRDVNSETGMIESESSRRKLMVFPNPAKNQLQIECANSENGGYISIYNSNGQQVNSVFTNDLSNNTINIDFLPGGSYFLTIDDNQSIISTSFVKE